MILGMPFLLETPSLVDACRLCRELGLSFVELNANFPACQVSSLHADDLFTLKKRYGIDMTFHVEEACDPFAFQDDVREAWLYVLRQTMDLAIAVQMPIINMHLPKGVYITLHGERVFLYARYRDCYLRSVEVLRQMCEAFLKGTGIRMAIENTDGFQPHEQEAVELLLQSSIFGLTLDIGHCHGAGNVDLPFYQSHAGQLIHMHGHDALGRKNHLALGDGEIDLPSRFAWAARNNARIVLETKTIAALRTSTAWLATHSFQAL
ncbi:MAG: sugar phosphate isomerase/epimerase family protein [Aristaeellaceae bacterium]